MFDGRELTSKGNQFKIREEEKWYKADFLGYEGASEYLCSSILEASNISDYVSYRLSDFQYHGQNYRGCVSKHFKPEDVKIVTISELYERISGKLLGNEIRIMETEAKIRHVVEFTEQETGLTDFGAYLTTLLEFDAFVLNEDRHLNNIAVLYDATGDYDYCPIFDNGAAFLSDTARDYPIQPSAIQTIPMLAEVKAKPFSGGFREQVLAAQKLYGTQFQLHKSVYQTVARALSDIRNVYGNAVADRMFAIFTHQVALYKDYFVHTLTIPDWKAKAGIEMER